MAHNADGLNAGSCRKSAGRWSVPGVIEDQVLQVFQRAERPDGDVPVFPGPACPCQDAAGISAGADRPVDVAAGRCYLFQVRFRLHAGHNTAAVTEPVRKMTWCAQPG